MRLSSRDPASALESRETGYPKDIQSLDGNVARVRVLSPAPYMTIMLSGHHKLRRSGKGYVEPILRMLGVLVRPRRPPPRRLKPRRSTRIWILRRFRILARPASVRMARDDRGRRRIAVEHYPAPRYSGRTPDRTVLVQLEKLTARNDRRGRWIAVEHHPAADDAG